MPDPGGDASRRRGPNNENVSTRVNVAFPFSQIRVEQPTAEVVEMAALIRELAELLADVAPGPRAAQLAERAAELVTRLK